MSLIQPSKTLYSIISIMIVILLSDQDTGRFLMSARIEPQIFYSTIRDFTS